MLRADAASKVCLDEVRAVLFSLLLTTRPQVWIGVLIHEDAS